MGGVDKGGDGESLKETRTEEQTFLVEAQRPALHDDVFDGDRAPVFHGLTRVLCVTALLLCGSETLCLCCF